jgi:hypothetical protein
VSTSQSQIAIDLQREATEYARMKDQADNLAKFGDFSGYKALGYTDAEIAQMRAVWAAENPLLAAAVGMGGYGYAGGYSGGGSGRGRGTGSGTPTDSTTGNGNGTAKKSGSSGSSGSVNGIGGAIGRAVGGGIGAILSGEGPSGNRSGASAKSGNSSKWWRDPKTGALYYIDN